MKTIKLISDDDALYKISKVGVNTLQRVRR